jgi:hypothetical protein
MKLGLTMPLKKMQPFERAWDLLDGSQLVPGVDWSGFHCIRKAED